MIESHGKKLYELVVDRNMIDDLKDLRKKTHAIRGNAISGGFNGILRALGAQMERESGINNKWDKITGPIAYEQASNINNLLDNIQSICLEVNSEKDYFGMLKQLALEMTENHGKFGET